MKTETVEKAFASGKMVIGCNYWASHAGTSMWSDWRPEVVREDFVKLAAIGLQVVRIFPLWPDFQPLRKLYSGGGHEYELRLGEREMPLPDTEAGRAGVDQVMVDRFQTVADLAQEHGLKLAVGLVTGWMSGRMFAPPAFESLNLLTDPLVIKWQVRMVRYLVKSLKNHPAVVAWSPGNECNCMAPANRDQAWLWTNTITAAIRAEDPSRQITSGMHSLLPITDSRLDGKSWTIHDQAELTDVLTTHPYPMFTPHAMRDPVNRIRNCFHATAESRFYGDIGGKPCLAEELGTLAAMLAGEKVKADYIRNTLFNLWAHDCLGLLWWCGFDQLNLEHAPYDWTAVERELGLFKTDGTPKPVAHEFTRFRRLVEAMPSATLPRFRRQAVCILSGEQDTWGNAWSSFLLAKQAGFDLEFQYVTDPLKTSDFYLLPGINGSQAIPRRCWLELLARVEAGATLYVSLDNGLLAPFNQIFGVEAQHRALRSEPAEWDFAGNHFRTTAPVRLELQAETAEVLARETDGNPVFLSAAHGKGKVYLLTVPLERHLAETSGQFPAAEQAQHYRIYQEMTATLLEKRLVRSGNPLVTVTEHPVNDHEAVVIMVNNQPDPVSCRPEIQHGWQISRMLHGEWNGPTGTIGGNNAVILELVKK